MAADSTLSTTKIFIPDHELTGAALALKTNTELIQATAEELNQRSAEILDLIQNHLIPTLNSQMDALRQLLELEIALERQCTLIEGQQRQIWDSWQKERDMLSKKEEMIYQTQIAPLYDRYQTLRKQESDFRHNVKYKLEAYFNGCLNTDAWAILCAVNDAKKQIETAKGNSAPHRAFRKGYVDIFQSHHAHWQNYWKE